jgi:ribulose bisphosphate carboxylase small subunit
MISIGAIMLKSFRSSLKLGRKPSDVQYIIVEQFNGNIYQPKLEENIEQVKDLLKKGYKIVSSVSANDDSIHYILKN